MLNVTVFCFADSLILGTKKLFGGLSTATPEVFSRFAPSAATSRFSGRRFLHSRGTGSCCVQSSFGDRSRTSLTAFTQMCLVSRRARVSVHPPNSYKKLSTAFLFNQQGCVQCETHPSHIILHIFLKFNTPAGKGSGLGTHLWRWRTRPRFWLPGRSRSSTGQRVILTNKGGEMQAGVGVPVEDRFIIRLGSTTSHFCKEGIVVL